MNRSFFKIKPLIKGGLLGGIAISSYLLVSKPVLLEDKPLSLQNNNNFNNNNYISPHFSSSPFAPEMPHCSPEYNRAIIASLPHLISFQQLWGAPGISISVMVKGELVWSQAFGYADVENAIPLSTESRMRVASISKAFTSAAMGILYENGKLDLDKPIQFYLPHFPQNSVSPITPRLLASHLSGIRHYLPPDSVDFYSTINYKSVLDAVEVFKDNELIAPPGTKYFYSTFGFTVLSAVLEKASGQDFLSLMQQKVFEPVGMLHTCHDDHGTVIPHRARHYKHEAPLKNSPYL